MNNKSNSSENKGIHNMYCPHCGHITSASKAFCESCSTRIWPILPSIVTTIMIVLCVVTFILLFYAIVPRVTAATYDPNVKVGTITQCMIYISWITVRWGWLIVFLVFLVTPGIIVSLFYYSKKLEQYKRVMHSVKKFVYGNGVAGQTGFHSVPL